MLRNTNLPSNHAECWGGGPAAGAGRALASPGRWTAVRGTWAGTQSKGCKGLSPVQAGSENSNRRHTQHGETCPAASRQPDTLTYLFLQKPNLKSPKYLEECSIAVKSVVARTAQHSFSKVPAPATKFGSLQGFCSRPPLLQGSLKPLRRVVDILWMKLERWHPPGIFTAQDGSSQRAHKPRAGVHWRRPHRSCLLLASLRSKVTPLPFRAPSFLLQSFSM